MTTVLEDKLFKMFQQNLAERWTDSLNEFAHNHGGQGGDYLKALASAWYNDTFTTGSLQKGIKSKQDVERLLQRGIVCPDGKTRKYNIDYNANFDGVDIYSDDYYEHGDHDDTIDSRTGQKWGPYEFITFHDSQLDEGWSQKYKKSINCSHPKGFSQKAHCAGKKKHNEDITMEAVCPDCGMCKTHGNMSLNEIKKGQKDSNGFTKCWPGKHAEGTKKGKNGKPVRNCVPNESQGVAEAAPSTELQDKMRQVRPKGKGITRTELQNAMRRKGKKQWHCPECATYDDNVHGKFCSKYKPKEQGLAEGLPQTLRKVVPGYAKREIDKKMDAGKFGKTDADKDANFQRYKKIQDKLKEQGVAEDWNKVNHHDKTNGLSQKAVNAYRHEHPGSKLKTAVTTKPSKLKAGSKDAKRRKSFCARMSGNEGPMKKPNGKPTPKALALRRWNCESVEELNYKILMAEQELDQLFEKSTTEKQARTMAAAAHDPKFAKKLGIKQSIAKEFNKADTGTKQLSNAMKHKKNKGQMETQTMNPSYPFAGKAVGQKTGKAGQLRGTDAGKLGGKQPAQGKLVGGT